MCNLLMNPSSVHHLLHRIKCTLINLLIRHISVASACKEIIIESILAALVICVFETVSVTLLLEVLMRSIILFENVIGDSSGVECASMS